MCKFFFKLIEFYIFTNIVIQSRRRTFNQIYGKIFISLYGKLTIYFKSFCIFISKSIYMYNIMSDIFTTYTSIIIIIIIHILTCILLWLINIIVMG